MNVVLSIFNYIGTVAGKAAAYIQKHPSILLVIVMAVSGGAIGSVVVSMAKLVNPMKGLFLILYVMTVPVAALSVRRDRVLSKRLWISLLVSVMGLLSFRVTYDLIGLEAGSLRSNLTGVFGLVCGITGFLITRD